MRTVSAAVTLAQKSPSLVPAVKIALTAPASVLEEDGTSDTYDGEGTTIKTRILSVDHAEEQWSQTASVVLSNHDNYVTDTNADWSGFTGVISYGINGTYSGGATAPLKVVSQERTSAPGVLTVTLKLVGILDLMADDHASAEFEPTSADLQTIKDLVTQVVKAVLPDWATGATYYEDDLIKPIAQNGFVYRAQDGGTSDASTEPTWPTTIGDTVVDNSGGSQITWKNIGKEMTVFSHCLDTIGGVDGTDSYTPTFDTEDYLIDLFIPAEGFAIAFNESRLTVLKKLMFLCKSVVRVEDDGEVHFRLPIVNGPTWEEDRVYAVTEFVQPTVPNNDWAYRCTTAGRSSGTEPSPWNTTGGGTTSDGGVTWTTTGFDNEYKVGVTGQHPLIRKTTRERVVLPNLFSVSTPPSPPYTGTAYSNTAEWKDSSDITNMERKVFHEVKNLASDVEAGFIAKAFLEQSQLGTQRGAGLVQLHVGQEVHDRVKMTDRRDNDAVTIGNISYLRRMVNQRDWVMEFALGAEGGGPLGLYPDGLIQVSTGGADPGGQEIPGAIEARLQGVEATIASVASRTVDALKRQESVFQAVTIDLFRRVKVLEDKVVELFRLLDELLNVTIISADYTVLKTDEVISCNQTGAIEITLPNDLAVDGFAIIINDESDDASSNNITIDPEGVTTIDGATTLVLNTDSQSTGIYARNQKWFTVAGSDAGDQRRDEFLHDLETILGDARFIWLPKTGETLTSTDASRHGATITYSKDVTTFDDPPGTRGSGKFVHFDGTDEEADTLDNARLSFGDGAADQALSMGGWIKPDVNNAAMTILSKLNDATTEEWELHLNASGHPQFDLWDASASAAIGREDQTAIGTGDVFLAGTYDGSGALPGIKVYVNAVQLDDGNSDATTGTYIAMEDTASLVRIGMRYTTPERFYNGKAACLWVTAKQLTVHELEALNNLGNAYFHLSL